MYVQLLVLSIISCLNYYLSTMSEFQDVFDQINQNLLHPYMVTYELIWQRFFSVNVLT